MREALHRSICEPRYLINSLHLGLHFVFYSLLLHLPTANVHHVGSSPFQTCGRTHPASTALLSVHQASSPHTACFHTNPSLGGRV